MADTRVATGLTVEQWDDKFFTEFLTENRFSESMGTDEASIVQVKENLMKQHGDRINFALVNRLTNDAVTGSAILMGNEEDMISRSFEVTVNKRRNAVKIPEIDEQYSAISLRDAARAVLKDWSMKDTEQLIINAFSSKNGVRYAASSEAQRDTWLVDNADRVMFGALRSNSSSNDHSTSLATLDTTADLFNAVAVSNMKTVAETVARPKIRPIRSVTNKGRRYYCIYAHPFAFNDLKRDTAIVQAQREVMLQMENERLFEGGDLYWDGCIIKQIEEANVEWDYGLVGTASARVTGAFLTGAQAIGTAFAKRWTSKQEEFDYGDKHGVAIESIYGIEKMLFGSGTADRDNRKDHGVVSGYFATLGLA